MADVRYNLSELFRATFGINSPIFITEPLNKEATAAIGFTGLESLPDYYKADATSWMGTPIIGQMKFLADNYAVYLGTGELDTIQMDDYVLPPATLFSFRRAKNITKTNLLGSNGTVKEIFGFDDWIIDVKGFCLDDGNSSAREKINQLERWVTLADSIRVYSKLLVNKKIYRVVIEEYSQEATQGAPGVIPFSMQLCSDEPVEFEIQSEY